MESLRAVFDIHLARDQVRNDGDRRGDILDERRAFLGIITRVLAQQRRLEADEVRLIFLYVADKFRRIVALCVAVGVFAVGQQHHLHVKALLEEHVDTAQRRVDTRRIAVVQHGDITREALDKPYLGLRQCRSATGDDILYTRLVHRDDVHLALYQIAHVRPRDSLFGLEKTV